MGKRYWQGTVLHSFAVFPILSDVVEVKTGSWSSPHWRIHFIRLDGWLRHSFAQLITLLDIDGIGQSWEDSNTSAPKTTRSMLGSRTRSSCPLQLCRQSFFIENKHWS